VSLEVQPGEALALVGENGAGKTTLMRIAAGELAPDSGSVSRHGLVELVHQHFMLVPELSIAENLALGSRRPFRFATRRTLIREALRTIEESGIALGDPERRVSELAVGEKSKLELIKALSRHPATLVLDEPTSVLTPHESAELFHVMRQRAARGTAVVFISHKLREVLEVADRIVVMRGGQIVADRRTSETSAEQLANEMVRSNVPLLDRERSSPESRAKIVAIVGVAGNGQAELARRLRDENPDAAHIPEDRTRDGIVAEMSIAENLALRCRRWNRRSAVRNARDLIAAYSIRCDGPLQRAGSLSGGNQQKVVLARELDRDPTMIVAAEPTRGLDLDATRFVHDQLRRAASNGASIVLITSDLDEAFALADEIQVIYRGSLSPRMTPAEAASRVAGLMAGLA
jgi:simple sugar transport system ATP-binding protein